MKKPAFEALAMAAGKLLGQKVASELSEQLPDFVMAVPNHWLRRLIHRTCCAEVLAQAISRQTGIRCRLATLRRVRGTKKQGMLSWHERKKNVRGAFAVRKSKWLAGSHVLLVDDVFTSGATAGEIAKLLRTAGAARVSLAIAARGTGLNQPSNMGDSS